MKPTKLASGPSPEALDIVRDLPALVPLNDAAKFLTVTTRTVRRWIRIGKLRAYRTALGSGRVLISRTEIARMLDAMRVVGQFEAR